ncbi:MAG TPA: alkene reductase [Bryobacteraceae bacterium]|nr:alkene reductase [Bryobacteraceae bacterium]
MPPKKILTPLQLGPYRLRSRVFMAPLTRMRAGERNVPTEMNVEYYRQRASAGLIVTEATPVSPSGHGYVHTPGIHTEEQRDGWRPITKAVHEAGGVIFQQLFHAGRLSHPDLQPGGVLPVAPSAIRPSGVSPTYSGPKERVTPRALEAGEMAGVIDEFRRAALLSLEAGFDGVEIHSANGYLPDEFLNSGSNHRTDEWGGPVENRARFLLEITDAAIGVWGASRVGVRLSPSNIVGDIEDADRPATYSYAVRKLNERGVSYVHIVSPRVQDNEDIVTTLPLGPERFRPLLTGETRLIAAGGYQPADAEDLIQSGHADAVAFGRWFIANPDLPLRIELDAVLNRCDRSTFYGGTEKGYTDYPTLSSAKIASVSEGVCHAA